MHIKFVVKDMKKSLAVVQKSVNGNHHLPILKTVCISTDNDDKIKLSTSDLDICTTSWIKGKVVDEGSICLPFKVFKNIMDSLPSYQVVTLSINDKYKASMACDNIEVDLKGIDPLEFPLFSNPEFRVGMCIEAGELKLALNQVLFSVCESDARPLLNGVHFTIKDGQLSLTSTDGFRLSKKELEFVNEDEEVNALSPIIIPYRVLSLVEKSVDLHNMKYVYISANNKIISFHLGNTLYSSSIISEKLYGEYPDFNKVIPQEYTTKISVLKSDFLNVVKKYGFNGNGVRMVTQLESISTLGFRTYDPKSKTIEQSLDATISGNIIEFALSPQFLAEALKAIDSEYVEIMCEDPKKPITIKGVNDATYLHVIMPMLFDKV